MESIIEKIESEGILDDIINTVGKRELRHNLQDLKQDIYLELLCKGQDKLATLYNNKGLRFYLSRIVTNNIHSKTSRYHYAYRLPRLKEEQIDETEE